MKTLIFALLISTTVSAQIQTDKVAHFGVGYVSGVIATGLTKPSKLTWFKSIAIGFGTSATLGIGKEIYDKSKGKEFSYKDIGATVLGGIIGSVSVKIVIFKTNKHHDNY